MTTIKQIIISILLLSFSANAKDVVVAVIDTGIDSNHKDLKGCVLKGYNFVNNDLDTNDSVGHGTHIAGIIHGIALKAKLLPLKYYKDTDKDWQSIENTKKAIYSAINKKVNIINYSSTGIGNSYSEYLALKQASDKGIIIVVAAGNNGNDIEINGNESYPASYTNISNMITVGYLDENNDKLSDRSNYSKNLVDFAIRGENIRSTLPNNTYGYLSGSSMSAAITSGIIARLLEINPKLNAQQIKYILISTAIMNDNLRGKIKYGKLNYEKAIILAKKMVTIRHGHK